MLVNKKFENSSNIIVNRWLLTGYLLISCSGGYSDRKIRFFYPPLRAFITKVTPWHIFPDWHKPGNNYVSTQLSQNKAKYWRSVWKFWNETLLSVVYRLIYYHGPLNRSLLSYYLYCIVYILRRGYFLQSNV